MFFLLHFLSWKEQLHPLSAQAKGTGVIFDVSPHSSRQQILSATPSDTSSIRSLSTMRDLPFNLYLISPESVLDGGTIRGYLIVEIILISFAGEES